MWRLALPRGGKGAGFILPAHARKLQPVLCDPSIDAPRQATDDRHMVHPRPTTVVRQLAGDPVDRVRPDVDRLIRLDQPHTGVEIALGDLGKAPFQARLLPRDVLEAAVAVPPPASASAAPTPTEVEVTIDIEVAPGTTRVRLNLRLILNLKRG